MASQNQTNSPDNEKNKFQNNKTPDTSQQSYTFEEAVALTRSGKFHYLLLLTCGLCFLTVMSQMLCVSIILPYVKCDLEATLSEQALLASAAFFGLVCSSHITGFLGDTWGRVKTVKWSVILSTIFSVTSTLSVNIWMLAVTRFLTGFFASGCQSCVLSLCNEFHSNRTRTRHVTLISVFLPMSLIYVPIEAILILPLHIDFTLFGMVISPWRFLLLAVNISAILALVLLCLTPETPKYQLIHGNHEKALNTLQKMFTTNTRRPAEEYPVRQLKIETTYENILDVHSFKDALKLLWKQTIAVFYKDIVWQTLNICLILFLVFGISNGILMWYPTILVNVIDHKPDYVCRIISETDISGHQDHELCNGKVNTFMCWLMVFAGSTFTASYLVFSFIIQKVGKKNLLMFWLVFCSTVCVAVHWISNLPTTVLALTIVISVGNCAGIVGTIAVEFFPTNISAMSICLIMMIGRLGAAAGSNIIPLFLFSHCDITFWALAAVTIFVAFLSYLLPNKKSKKPNELP